MAVMAVEGVLAAAEKAVARAVATVEAKAADEMAAVAQAAVVEGVVRAVDRWEAVARAVGSEVEVERAVVAEVLKVALVECAGKWWAVPAVGAEVVVAAARVRATGEVEQVVVARAGEVKAPAGTGMVAEEEGGSEAGGADLVRVRGVTGLAAAAVAVAAAMVTSAKVVGALVPHTADWVAVEEREVAQSIALANKVGG